MADITYSMMERVGNIDFLGVLYKNKALLPVCIIVPGLLYLRYHAWVDFSLFRNKVFIGCFRFSPQTLKGGLGAEPDTTNLKVPVVFTASIDADSKVSTGT